MVTLSSFVPLQYLPRLWKRDRRRPSEIDPVPERSADGDLLPPVRNPSNTSVEWGVLRVEMLLLLSMPIPSPLHGMDFSILSKSEINNDEA
jgi:hypothetical protein